jgi:hypothetical protein
MCVSSRTGQLTIIIATIAPVPVVSSTIISGTPPTSTSSTATASPTSAPSKSNIGAIVGGAVGGVAFLGILAIIGIYMCLNHKKKVSQQQQQQSATAAAAAGGMAGTGMYGGGYVSSPTKEEMARYSVQPTSSVTSPMPEYSQYPPGPMSAVTSSPTGHYFPHQQYGAPPPPQHHVMASELPSVYDSSNSPIHQQYGGGAPAYFPPTTMPDHAIPPNVPYHVPHQPSPGIP